MKNKNILFFALLIISFSIIGCVDIDSGYVSLSDPVEAGNDNEGNLTVHFIDVGQGDSILIETPNGNTMLIDGGSRSEGVTVIKYLNQLDISTINVMVATHPHEDHIGGLNDVLSNFNVLQVYDPGVVHTSQTYENFLLEIDAKNIDYTIGKAGHSIDLDPNIAIEIISPEIIDEDELNDDSIVIKMTYHDVSFLFTGDAESPPENAMVQNYNVDATILKVGHHGSSSSTSQTFLNEVSPEVAIISEGVDNSYGHPTSSTLNKLESVGAYVYRTDIHGTVIVSTDGYTYNVNTEYWLT